MDHQKRLRRPITRLNESQRRAFFWCLKMLPILPPIQGKSSHGAPSFEQWKFLSNGDEPILPKNLHDVLMASHSTVCQHHSIYFGYYHRHLLVLAEVFLNYCHKILLHPEGIAHLKALYPNHPELYSQKASPKWKSVFKTYKQFASEIDFISMHYWAPTNYLDKEHMTVPPELSAPWNINDPSDTAQEQQFKKRRVESQKQVDELYKEINHSEHWEAHAAYRWRQKYSEQTDHKFQDHLTRRFDSPYYRKIVDEKVTTEDVKLLEQVREGTLNPRTDYSLFKEVYLKGYSKYSALDRVRQLDKNFKRLRETGNWVLTNMTAANLRVNQGGAEGGYQFISRQEEKAYNQAHSESMGANEYNNMLPHFHYAHSFYTNKSAKSFLRRTEYERSHDCMHDYLRLMFTDSKFALAPLVFFPFHANIDLLLQMFMRKISYDQKQTDNFNHVLRNEHRKTWSKNGIEGSRITYELSQTQYGWGHLEETVERVMRWYKPEERLEKSTVGNYPMPQYFSTLNGKLQFSAAFNALDYIMTPQKTIRTTKQLSPIYQNYMYSQRFEGYQQFATFPFDHEYELFEGQLLGDDVNKQVNVPRYLELMKTTVLPPQILQEGDEGESDDEQLTERKLFKQPTLLFIKYRSNSYNGTYPVFIKFPNLGSVVSWNSDQKLHNRFEQLRKRGLAVHVVNIFGRGQFADDCPNCASFKELTADFDLNFRRGSFQLWRAIHLNALNPVLFDSQQPTLKVNCLSDLFQVAADPMLAECRLVTGTKQIQLTVKYPQSYGEREFIRLEAESYSVNSGLIRHLMSKKKKKLNTTFEFVQIIDQTQGGDSSIFDTFVYRRVKGFAEVNGVRVQFDFKIPSFQRVIRLDMAVVKQGDKIQIVVEDHDFKLKQQYYSHAKP